MRSVPEWIGKTDDSRPPPHVRARIFDARGGICFLSGRKIQAGERWELHHVKEIREGGENRESNLAPVLIGPHRKFTAEGKRRQGANDRVRRRHIGIKKNRRITGWRRFNGEAVRAPRER